METNILLGALAAGAIFGLVLPRMPAPKSVPPEGPYATAVKRRGTPALAEERLNRWSVYEFARPVGLNPTRRERHERL